MSTQTTREENKAIVRREFDRAWNANDRDVLDELYAENVRVGTVRSGSDEALVTREDVKSLHAEWDDGFSDATTEINELVAEDDAVMVWWTIRGTHDGPFRGVEPTGNRMEIDGFSFRRIEGGTIVEVKDATSMLSLFGQLGVELPV